MKDRFDHLVVLNTGLFGGADWPSPGFMRWRGFAERVGLDLPVGRVMSSSVVTALDDAVVAAYEAPFPTRESRAGAAAFPLLVPIAPGEPAAEQMRAVAEELRAWHVPALVIWSDQDPVFTIEHGQAMADSLPGAGGRVSIVAGAGHMLQEDKGEEVAERILEWFSSLDG
jgi:haloalkane dehalogenase